MGPGEELYTLSQAYWPCPCQVAAVGIGKGDPDTPPHTQLLQSDLVLAVKVISRVHSKHQPLEDITH